MYTRVESDHKIIQIRCGNDFCDNYKIGDTVPFYVDPEIYGSACFTDGVYDGLEEGNNNYDRYWVIIKDSKIEAVYKEDEIDCVIDPDDSVYAQIQEFLIKKYDISSEYNLYSPECLERKRLEIEAHQKEWEEKVAHLSSDEKFLAALVAPISVSYNYDTIAKNLLSMESLPDGVPKIVLPKYEFKNDRRTN